MMIQSHPMSHNHNSKHLNFSKSSKASSTNINTISDDLSGLVMTPLVINAGDGNASADIESDSGCWYRLIRPEIAGGLALGARYVRGPTRKRELDIVGVAIKDNVVVLQLKFENQRTDSISIRRIRLIQRTSPTLRSAILPLEIPALKKQQSSSTLLTLSFSPTHIISSLSAKFDVKSDKSSTTLDIRPSLSEMLGKLKLKESEFYSMTKKYSGLHQKVSSTFVWDGGDRLWERIEKYCNLTPVLSEGNEKERKFAASLPDTKESMLVIFNELGLGTVVIYCDNLIAANSLMESIKSTVRKE